MGSIAQPPDGDRDVYLEQILVTKIMELMTAGELRAWCSKNGVHRSRGDDKRETAFKAVQQNREAVINYILENN